MAKQRRPEDAEATRGDARSDAQFWQVGLGHPEPMNSETPEDRAELLKRALLAALLLLIMVIGSELRR